MVRNSINGGKSLIPRNLHFFARDLDSGMGDHVVSPYVRPTKVHFYITQERKAKTWVELLDLRPAGTGGNVSMVLPYDEGVFYGVRQVVGVKVVSKVQLYIDLFYYPARGEEAAEVILKALEKK